MISIQNLSFTYHKKAVFDSLDLQFKAGHIYGLLGGNGAGKSTLLRNIAGLLRPESGSISVNGYTPAQRLPVFLSDIFMIPEEFYLPDMHLTNFIRHNAAFYPRFDTSKFDSYLAAFDIPSGTALQQLSYGQKKKVMIAFALATQVSVLLMDEPTNGLDIISKSQFRKILAQAVTEEHCVIISTHQVKDLENLIDRVTVIDEGKILFDQETDVIAQKLSFRFAYDRIETANAIYSESSLSGNMIVAENTDHEESKPDLELLYKAIVTNKDKITQLFQS